MSGCFCPAVEWIPTCLSDATSLSDRAVVAGHDGDGSPLWAIKAHFNGEVIPGKFAPEHRAAYVPLASKEIAVDHFQVCCARPERVRWVPCRDGFVPHNAVVAGKTAACELLYTGRANYKGTLTPGKVQPSEKKIFISFDGAEISFYTYEVLCTNNYCTIL